MDNPERIMGDPTSEQLQRDKEKQWLRDLQEDEVARWLEEEEDRAIERHYRQKT